MKIIPIKLNKDETEYTQAYIAWLLFRYIAAAIFAIVSMFIIIKINGSTVGVSLDIFLCMAIFIPSMLLIPVNIAALSGLKHRKTRHIIGRYIYFIHYKFIFGEKPEP